MQKIIFIIFILPISTFGQVYKYNRIFNDSTVFKNFNQGYLDSQEFFIATNDYLLGLASTPLRGIPAVISYMTPPKNSRLENVNNPNNTYLNLNIDYYNGYKYGATKKKRKRLIQGTLTPIAVVGTILIVVLSSYSN